MPTTPFRTMERWCTSPTPASRAVSCLHWSIGTDTFSRLPPGAISASFPFHPMGGPSRPESSRSMTTSGSTTSRPAHSVRLTSEPLDEIFPQWTHDGTRIAFGTRTGKIFWKPSDGSGEREELSHGEYPRYPDSFSPDGKSMAFVEIHPSRRRDIWLMPLVGDRQVRPLLTTDADEWGARFSPDGHWLAYVSE